MTASRTASNTAKSPVAFLPWMGLSTRAAIAGDSVSATKAEMMTETETATANSMNSRPVVLFWKASGVKTATSERVMAMTAKLISSIALNAAAMGFIPSSRCR